MLNSIAEIAVYVFVDLFFNTALAVIALHKTSRFSIYKNILLMIILFVVIVAFRKIGLESVRLSGMLSVLLVIVYLLCCFISFEVQINRLVFVVLIIVNYASFVAIVYSFFTIYFEFGLNEYVYSYRSSGLLFMIMLCTSPPVAYLMKHKIEPLISTGINNKAWNYLWIVPAIFCFSYYYNLFSNGGFVGYTTRLENIVFTIIFNYSGIIITFLISNLVKESNDFTQIRAENYILDLQTMQYDNMKNYMEETRRAKHDMRQMLAVIQSGFIENDMDKLKNYINKHIDAVIPDDITIHYCENYAMNALFVYYGDLAKKNSIQFKTEINYPEDNNLEEPDMIILFGNLIENAYEACLKQEEGQRFISLVIRIRENTIVITVDNSFNGKVRELGSQLLSSKIHGMGIGISSIKKIVEKYNGIIEFEYNQYIFKASLFFKIKQNEKGVS